MSHCFRQIRNGLLALVAFAWLGGGVTPAAAEPHAFHVDVVGHGQPMILVPGFASSGDTWKTTVARYQNRYTCHVLTLAGFAGQPPIEEPLFAAARAELAQYIRDQHLAAPVLVGHSLGGTLVLAVAADHPELVGPVVAVDSLPFYGGVIAGAKDGAEAAPIAAQIRNSIASMPRSAYDDYARSGASTKFMVTSPSDLEILKSWSLASDQRTVANTMAEFIVLDGRDELSRITAPVLVLGTWTGLRDQTKTYNMTLTREMVVSQFEEQFRRLARLHFALAERARHFIMFDDPAWFFAELDRFLADPAAAVRDRGFAPKN